MARITFNTTIDEATQRLIGKLAVGLTKGQVVDAAVAMYDQSQGQEKKEIGDVVAKLESMSAMLKLVKDGVLDLLSQGVSVNEAPAVPAPFNAVQRLTEAMPGVTTAANGFPIQCVHCKEPGRGSTKHSTLCFDCKRGGHTLTPAECPVCCDYGTGAL